MRRVTGNHGSAKPKGRRCTSVTAGPAVAAALLGVILPARLVHAGPPSFDCGKATTWAERAICASPTLSALDREVAAIYRDARSRASPSAAGALKARQQIWIGRREQCQGNADPAECLLALYEQRRAELTAGAGRALSSGVGGETPARQPLPELKADVVWRGDSSRIYQQCQFGDELCAQRVMRAEGATEQALRFAQRIGGWAVGFQELGPVDVVTAVGTYAANTLEYLFLANGTPDLIPLHEYGLTATDRARPDVQQVLRRLPDGFLFSHRFVRRQATERGTRFVVEADYARCNACRNEVLAKAEIGFDLDGDNRFLGARLLRLTAIGPPRR